MLVPALIKEPCLTMGGRFLVQVWVCFAEANCLWVLFLILDFGVRVDWHVSEKIREGLTLV